MSYLELLAPARNIEIGIAAIDSGADAVYVAGPGFGARQAAGNSIADVATLCEYAHKFGVRVYLTVNTIIYENELEPVHRMMLQAQDAGVDAFIIQDPALARWEDITVPLHASTQCAIRTPEKARFWESLGCSRLVLERQLSLQQVKEIRSEVSSELEFFVHGALCVCYSGQCYMSESISSRSANRGECIQACRSLYDLTDDTGATLVRNKALLSLKDYNLLHRLGDLADAGVVSFKIEGRLKNASYVRNVVREYSIALDDLVRANADKYARASNGRVTKAFTPAIDKTFNRGYTELFLDGKRGKWSSMDAPKSMGEKLGTISSVRRVDRHSVEFTLRPFRDGVRLMNGDGFSIANSKGVTGFRGDVCNGLTVQCKDDPAIVKGAVVFRNIDASFEKEMERNACLRETAVTLDICISGKFDIDITAHSESGVEVSSPFKADLDVAENSARAEALIREQLSKRSLHYSFAVGKLEIRTPGGVLPLMSASTLNSIRRLIASDIAYQEGFRAPLAEGKTDVSVQYPETADYKANIANSVTQEILSSRGAQIRERAFEVTHRPGAELMRTRYCIRYELGMCPVHQGARNTRPLFLVNNGRRFALHFDCASCEMTVTDDTRG